MSVALRTITRLQDADDINVSLGVGVDEYALVYDHDTAKFVLRAMSAGVTDHGALTGLADDDHTQYLLATGARTGANSQAQVFTSGIVGPTWKPASDSTTALKVQNAAGSADILTVDTTSGLLGVGTTPTRKLHVKASSSGIPLVEIEQTSSWGGANFALSVIGYTNLSGMRINGADSVNSFYNAGSFGFTGSAGSEISFNHWTGVVSTRLFINGSGLVGVGTAAPGSQLHALLSSAATNDVTNVLTVGHDTSGTAANGFGAGQLFALESSTTAAQSAARIQVLWNDATHASRKADLVLTAYDSGGEREGLRIRGNGSAPAIAVLGATPIARKAHVANPTGGATVDAEARTAINAILASLEDFGFHATS